MVLLTIKYLVSGVTMVLLGIFLTAWTPTDMILYDRLYMRRGFLPFVWWQEPPDSVNVVNFQMHFFNVTNPAAFLNGSDSKLNFEEVGPYVFGDKVEHFWTTHNANDTLSYGTKHNLIYDVTKNSEDLDVKLTVPNFSLLALASMVSEMNMFYKLMFHGIYRSIRPKLFVETTPRKMLWNFSDPLLDKFKKFLPFVIPIKGDIGILTMINPMTIKNITVFLGAKNGHEKFFTIDNFDGSKYLPKHGPECQDTLADVSESQFPQYVKRTSHLKLFKDNYCRYIELFYEKDVSMYGVDAYEFQASKALFYRTQPLENDCYKGDPPLPNGVADLSQCVSGISILFMKGAEFFLHQEMMPGLPFVISQPHFLNADFTQDKISGYKHNATRFPNYVIVEPLSGAPLESELSCQVNIQIKNLTGIDASLKIFDNLFLPMAWVKIHQGLPWYIAFLLFLAVKLAPILNVIVCAILIAGGGALVYFYVEKSRKINKRESDVANESDEAKKVTDKLISPIVENRSRYLC